MQAIHRPACAFLFLLLSACASTAPLPSQSPEPADTSLPPTQTVEPVWMTIDSSLATDPSWTADEVGLGFDMQILDAALVVAAPADLYANPVNTAGPFLEVTGDFGIRFELEASTADFAGVSLYGALPQEGQWWQGITRLDVGIKGGKVAVGYWDGGSPTPAVWQEYSPAGVFANRRLELGIRKSGETILILFKGQEIGQLRDPGLFASGIVYLGLNVAPQNQILLYSLVAEANHGEGVTIVR